MRKSSFYIFLLFSIFFLSCYPKILTKQKSVKENKPSIKNVISIKSNDLSEDVNILSTQNDELILLSYSKLDKEFPDKVLEAEFMMDSIYKLKRFPFTQKIKSNEDIIIVLIEMDTKQTIKQIEPIVRLNLKNILVAFTNEDNFSIKELLGDNDLLSINKLSFKKFQEQGLNIQGINLFDTFEYELTVE